eukprot:Colp12_sorted_trinity150504_noHs@28802
MFVQLKLPGFDLEKQLTHLQIANTANVSALVYHGLRHLNLKRINWVGFYLLRSENELVLGPFQGKVACVRIRVGKGVCGTTAKNRKTTVVEDVLQFPGHIACDAASRSEIVVPVFDSDKEDARLVGVFDLDCEEVGGFDEVDKVGLEKIATILAKGTDWSPLKF